jgi:hypothetical protein
MCKNSPNLVTLAGAHFHKWETEEGILIAEARPVLPDGVFSNQKSRFG